MPSALTFALILIADVPSVGRETILTTLSAVFAADLGPRCLVLDRDRPAAGGGPPDNARLAWIQRLRSLTDPAGATLGVTGRLDLALAAGVAAIQLPERGLSVAEVRRVAGDRLLIGRSCHDRAGLIRAERDGADWATLSPVRPPLSKPSDATPLGVEGIRRGVAKRVIPVFALGGITGELAAPLRDAGASGLATIGDVFMARDPAQRARILTVPWPTPHAGGA